jgi:hypothetical protein
LTLSVLRSSTTLKTRAMMIKQHLKRSFSFFFLFSGLLLTLPHPSDAHFIKECEKFLVRVSKEALEKKKEQKEKSSFKELAQESFLHSEHWELSPEWEKEIEKIQARTDLSAEETFSLLYDTLLKARLDSLPRANRIFLKRAQSDLLLQKSLYSRTLGKLLLPIFGPHYTLFFNRVALSTDEENSSLQEMVSFHEAEHALERNENFINSFTSFFISVKELQMAILKTPVSAASRYYSESRAIGAQWEIAMRLPEPLKTELIENTKQELMSPYDHEGAISRVSAIAQRNIQELTHEFSIRGLDFQAKLAPTRINAAYRQRLNLVTFPKKFKKQLEKNFSLLQELSKRDSAELLENENYRDVLDLSAYSARSRLLAFSPKDPEVFSAIALLEVVLEMNPETLSQALSQIQMPQLDELDTILLRDEAYRFATEIAQWNHLSFIKRQSLQKKARDFLKYLIEQAPSKEPIDTYLDALEEFTQIPTLDTELAEEWIENFKGINRLLIYPPADRLIEQFFQDDATVKSAEWLEMGYEWLEMKEDQFLKNSEWNKKSLRNAGLKILLVSLQNSHLEKREFIQKLQVIHGYTLDEISEGHYQWGFTRKVFFLLSIYQLYQYLIAQTLSPSQVSSIDAKLIAHLLDLWMIF